MTDDTKDYIKVDAFFGILALFVLCRYCYSLGRESVHSNGNGADTVREQLDSAGTTAKATTESIGSAERTAQEAQGTVRNIESIVASNGTAIENCKQILAGIRRRGAKETTTN